jgi:hypothetical protein
VLNKLALVEGDGPADKPTVRIPQDLVDTWLEHEKFKEDFQKIVEDLEEELGETFLPPGAGIAGRLPERASPQKRPAVPGRETPAKKRRVVADRVIEEQHMVGGDNLFKTPLVSGIGKDYSQVFLVVKPQHRIYIVNKSDGEVELLEGMLVAGFGKGRFKFKEQEPDANPETHVPFLLADSETKVLFGGGLRTLKELREEKRKTEGNPQICYHNMEEVPGGDIGAFKLSPTHEVLFSLLDQEVGGKELLVNRVAAMIPTSFWKCHCLDIYWACKWTTNGLQAVRPVVCLSAGVSLPAGHALACN